MKNFTKLRIALTMALMVAGMASVWGQTLPLSATSNISKQGTNGAGLAAPATEDPDRVTTGTQVIYLVKPDADLSPTWSAEVAAGNDARTTTGISSTATWLWTVPAGIAPFDPAANKGHFIILDVDGAATAIPLVIKVQEQNGASCAGSEKTIDVLIVDQPIASGVSVSSLTTCGSGTDGSLGVALPTFTLARTIDSDIPGDPSIIVDATFTFTALGSSTPVPIFSNKKLTVNGTTGVITNADIVTATGTPGYTLPSWGTYTLTINKISDKISRKDMGTNLGYFDATPVLPATSVAVSFTVLKPPTTGDIYRLPNN